MDKPSSPKKTLSSPKGSLDKPSSPKKTLSSPKGSLDKPSSPKKTLSSPKGSLDKPSSPKKESGSPKSFIDKPSSPKNILEPPKISLAPRKDFEPERTKSFSIKPLNPKKESDSPKGSSPLNLEKDSKSPNSSLNKSNSLKTKVNSPKSPPVSPKKNYLHRQLDDLKEKYSSMLKLIIPLSPGKTNSKSPSERTKPKTMKFDILLKSITAKSDTNLDEDCNRKSPGLLKSFTKVSFNESEEKTDDDVSSNLEHKSPNTKSLKKQLDSINQNMTPSKSPAEIKSSDEPLKLPPEPLGEFC